MWRAIIWLLCVMFSSMPAHAESVETAIMPGKVIAGHADLEGECKNCHVRFRKSAQTQLCLDCHKDVARDVAQRIGHHGRIEKIADRECRECHTDHKGREARIAAVDEKTFDHRLTDFMLRGGHADLKVACRDCHKTGVKWREAPSDCYTCHRSDDTHKGALGKDCASCHTERDWKETRFDHAKTKFPLTGKHVDVGCKDCHQDPKFKGAPLQCVGCHRGDDQKQGHQGKFGEKCESCHTDRGWKQITFDHDRDTKYRLKGKHATATCTGCHAGFLYKEKTPTTCVACHRADDQKTGHKGRFGEKCESCHVEKDWTITTFDHDRDTKYALKGKHATAKCTSCHIGFLYREKLATTCFSCHEKDDKHKGQEGRQCQTCHNERSWQGKDTAFEHALTRFPLLGKHDKVKCKECHLTAQFKDAKTECIACHRADDTHKLALGPQCETCHNAADWKQWSFDHDRRTDFKLDGKHKGLACEACHTQAMPRKVSLAGTCVSCHEGEDVHFGEFGRQCERCHVSSSFKKINSGAGRLLQ